MKSFQDFLQERCWPGHKPVPGKKPYSPGSCVKETVSEDLRNWFDPNHPKGGWKRVNTKGEVVGDCARDPGEPKPKCMSNAQRASLSKKEKASAVKRKRAQDPNPERQGPPINVKSKVDESMEILNEKNKPTNPELWSRAIAQAKSKFDVYPSAYANGWASKWYKSKGGGWKTVSEAKEKSEYDYEGDMARGQLQSIVNNAQRVHDMLEDNDNLPEWVQSKITLAEDYISTVANYMMSEVDEEVEIQESEALVENFEIINEVSLGAKIRAYASHAGNAFAHDDMGNDKEYKHHSAKADKIITHIEKHHGKEAVKHAERAAHSQIFGHPDHEHSGEDRLTGGLRGNKNLTKAGKVPKNTVSAMKNKIMAYGRHRNTAGPKAKLPEEVEHIEEGRQSQRHPLEGHEYHKKSDEALIHIAKDAHAAAEAMKSHNTTAENKYRDQANDSATVRHYRKTHGMADWYKKKYGHIKEEVVTEMDKSQTPPGRDGSNDQDAGKKEYTGKITTSSAVAKQGANILKKLPQGADFAAARRKARLASNGRMDEALSPAIRMQMALQKAKEDRERSERNGEAALAGKFSSGPAKQPMKNPSLVSPKNEQVMDEPNYNNSIQARQKKADEKLPFDEPTRKARGTVKDKSGAVHTAMSRVKDIAKKAARKQAGIKEAADVNDPLDRIDTEAKRSLSKTAGMVKDLATNAKSKAKEKAKKDTFEAEPELSSQIIKQ